MIFRQLFERGSSAYTYLLGCQETLEAVLLDPVLETVERDLSVLHALGLRLVCTVETHIHADHLDPFVIERVAKSLTRRPTGCRAPTCTQRRIGHSASVT
jgi:sulfur dioxygenase